MRQALERKLRAVRLRCIANAALRQFGLVLAGAGAAAAVAVLVEKMLAVRVISPWTAAAFSIAAVGLAIALSLLRRPSMEQTAALIDDRLDFRERFTTTLALSASDAPFAVAARAEAHEAAERLDVAGRFPVRPTRRWILTVASWLVAAGLLALLPQMDLLKRLAHGRERQRQEAALKQAKAEVAQASAAVESAVRRIGDPELTAEAAKLADVPEPAKPQDLRREAIRRLGDLSERVKQVQAGERLTAAKAMEEMLKGVRGFPGAEVRELNRAVAKGDFAKARDLVNDLSRRIGEGKLSKEQTQAMGRQLEDLGKQLQELSKGQRQLEEALQGQGLDKGLAKLSDQELRDAAEKAGLSRQQVEELMKKAAACRQACRNAAKLAEAFARTGKAAEDGQVSQEELAELARLAEQLDGLEGVMQDLAAAEAGLAEIARQIASLGGELGRQEGDGLLGLAGQGEFQEGLADRQGLGTGGPGQGLGARGTAEGGKIDLQKTRADGKASKGDIIASWYFNGPQVKGEARREFAEVLQAAKDGFAEAVGENRIPRKYEQTVKQYFGELEQKGREK